MNSPKTGRRGFTLIEVLLVIVIIGLLAGVLVVTLPGVLSGSKIDLTRSQMEQLLTRLERYQLQVGHYPREEEGGLQALVTMPAFDNQELQAKWSQSGPYADANMLVDQWNNPIRYELQDRQVGIVTRQAPVLTSNGPDGVEGTDDDIRVGAEDQQ